MRYDHETPPMSEMNTTPLIDVLLVLLVMLIITIPIQTHAVKLTLPTDGGSWVNPVRNTLTISQAGDLQWNGRDVAQPQLRSLLVATTQLASAPELHIRPDPSAPYGIVDEVLVLTRESRVERIGFVGNEAYARF